MKKICFLFSGLILNLFLSAQDIKKWFDKESVSNTVLLEKELSGNYIPHGTGVLIYPYKSNENIVVTCEHVLRNSSIFVTIEVDKSFRDKVRSLPKDEQKLVIDLLYSQKKAIWNINENYFRVKAVLKKDSSLFIHPKGLDIGIFKVNIPGEFNIEGQQYKITNLIQLGISRMHDRTKIDIGDDIYFIGFPFGIGSPQSIPIQDQYTTTAPRHLLRKGTIAWISEDYDEFLLDALSFGGNSGSPVFQVCYEDNKPPFYLIGMIIGHLADSSSNFGLARCLSINEINEVLKIADK